MLMFAYNAPYPKYDASPSQLFVFLIVVSIGRPARNIFVGQKLVCDHRICICLKSFDEGFVLLTLAAPRGVVDLSCQRGMPL